VEIDWSNIRNHPLNIDIRDQLDDNLEILSNSDGGDYVQTVQLEGFHGAFVNYSGSQSGSLYISPSILHSTSNSRIQTAKNKGWQLPVIIEQGNFSSSRGGIGMHPEARESRDWYDVLQVPKIAGQAEFLVYHQDYPMNRSIVPEQASYLWLAELTGGQEGETVKLNWNISEIPESVPGLFIWDELNSRLIDMKQNAQSHFQVPESGKLPLQIYYGMAEDVFSALDIRNINAGIPYPNPINDMFVLPLSIPVEQQLQANALLILYNNQGQQVAEYSFNQLTPGYQELEVPLPEGLRSGLYHYQLRITGTESSTITGRIIKQ
jgi:methionine-rich copper-binding protein CopC